MIERFFFECDEYTRDNTWVTRTEPGPIELLGSFHTPETSEQHARATWVIPSQLAWGDYIGSIVEASNRRVFLAQFDGRPGVLRLCGDAGWAGVALDFGRMDDETRAEVRTLFRALGEYVVLDSEDLAELETEREADAWQEWARADFHSALLARCEDNDTEWETVNGLGNEQLLGLFHAARETTGIEWTHEQAPSPFIDVDRLADALRRPFWVEAES